MNDQNWQLREGDAFAPAAPDSIEHLPSHHCAAVLDIKARLRNQAIQCCQLGADHIEALERRLAELRASGKAIIASEMARTKEVISLRDQLAEAIKDAARIDYIGSEDFHLVCNINAFWIEWPDGSRQCATYDSPRDAIDAAMKGQSE